MEKPRRKTRAAMTAAEPRETRVGDLMKTGVVTTSPNTTARDAWRIMEKNRIRHLPVVVGDRLVGILSERELYLYLTTYAILGGGKEPGHPEASDLVGIRIEAIMSRDPLTVGAGHALEDAARLMAHHRLSALPVVEGDKRLVGILTTQDILTHLSTAFRPGSLEE
ncbi:MAG: CBS domain-containing protein [Planctomycetes bacterium]|jgi:acetoin utilization protein AcuB|nr:CBS domain-containing protein [Planctomycetota bacterium]